ncbi:MAG: DegV family protein, partial [Clostridia bacterium]
LLLEYLLKKRDAGAKFDELVEYTINLVDHVCSYFTVSDLKHLASLGRVSKTQAFVGTLANIMPVLYVNKFGELVPIEKVVTRKKAIKALVDKMQDKMLPVDQQDVIFIGHGESLEDAEYLKQLVTERFGITNIIIDYVGTVIGCHSGYGTIALFFLGKDKLEAKDAHTAKLLK